MKFSTTADGTHAGGEVFGTLINYDPNQSGSLPFHSVNTSGTTGIPGTSDVYGIEMIPYTYITIPVEVPELYFYSDSQANVGGHMEFITVEDRYSSESLSPLYFYSDSQPGMGGVLTVESIDSARAGITAIVAVAVDIRGSLPPGLPPQHARHLSNFCTKSSYEP